MAKTQRTATLSDATADRDAASGELDAVLTQGGDATQARTKLKAAEAALSEAQAAEDARIAAEQDALRAESRELADQVSREVHEVMVKIVAGIVAPPAPEVATDHAAAVLDARQTAGAAKAAADTARAKLDSLVSRQEALQAARSAIVERRAKGDTQESDGQVLSLYDADLEGLGKLAGRAKSELAQAEAAVAAGVQELAQAERRWTGHTQRVRVEGLKSVAGELEGVLAEIADQLHQTQVGGVPSKYVPTDNAYRQVLHAVGFSPYR